MCENSICRNVVPDRMKTSDGEKDMARQDGRATVKTSPKVWAAGLVRLKK